MHRVLRLVIAVGTVSAGLCLVLAMVAIVVTMGDTSVSRTASTRPLTPAPADRHPAKLPAHPRIGATLATYRGTGSGQISAFQVSRPGDWGLAWRFNCAAGRRDQFAMTENANWTFTDMDISEAGRRGHGIWWETRDPGYHSLRVDTDCAWSVRVVLPWLPGLIRAR